ncbi:MAG TPA: FMN-binding protein [Nocardioides sp.]|nr:FMN-binding protein [Nocardioides sp.]
MRRIVLWLLSTFSAVALLFGYHTSTSGPAATAQAPIGASLSSPSPSPSTPSTSSSGSGGSSGTGAGKTSSSGSTVTGDVAQTRWGPVQVQLTTDGSGTITDVQVVEYPSGNGEDQRINSYALPKLVQETLDAQSAHIDMVSGATVTSDGYLQSLQSALDQVAA